MKKLPTQPLPKVMHDDFSAPALLNQVRKVFEKVKDPRRYGQQFSLTDVLMSGLAVFSLKFPSLLKFDEKRNEARIRANLQSLFCVNQAPVIRNFGRSVIKSTLLSFGRRLFTFISGFMIIVYWKTFVIWRVSYSVLMGPDSLLHHRSVAHNVVSVIIGMVKSVIIINY